jgi:hypothetical protein
MCMFGAFTAVLVKGAHLTVNAPPQARFTAPPRFIYLLLTVFNILPRTAMETLPIHEWGYRNPQFLRLFCKSGLVDGTTLGDFLA